jgi:inorganic triphosphatase YgiF
MGASLEVELKLRAETDAPLCTLAVADRLGPAALGPATEVAEVDRYLDTADGRLWAAGWACRLRSRGGETRISLKGPPADGTAGALHRRPEIDGPATDDPQPAAWPPSPAREQLVHLSAGADLGERLALRQLRTERSVSIDGERVGTLSLDRVRVERDGIEHGALLVVELEMDDRALERGVDPASMGQALLAIPGLIAEPHTKLERALALLPARAP